MIRIAIVAISICAFQIAFASGEMKERIQMINDSIKANPENSSLYVDRAQVYLESGDIEMAVLDLQSARQIAGKDIPSSLACYAEIYHRLGDHEVAQEYVDRLLDVEPFSVSAFKSKAKILESVGDLPSAIDYYKKVILYDKTPLPENYMSIVDNLLKENREHEAIFYCKQAINKLGPLLSFEQKLADIQVASGK